MAGKGDISPTIGLDGEKQFRDAIKNINTSLKTLDTEMKVVTSEYDKNDKSMTKLSKENEVYEKKLTGLNEKLAQQGKLLDAAKKDYDETAPKVQRLQQQYNRTQAEINNVSRKIEENNKLMSLHGKAVEVAGKALKAFGIAAGAAFTAAVAGAAMLSKAFAKIITDSAKAGDEILTMSAKTGISADQLQRYAYAADQIDVSTETITGSMTKLTRNMASAQSGSGSAAKAFKQLGIEVTKSDGSLRDRNEVFAETIDALGKIDDATNRDAVAMQIFGKSAQDLNPLILAGGDALKEMGDEAERAGIILSDSALSDLSQVNDNMARFKATAEGAKNLFAAAFAGPIAAALDKVTGYMQRLTAAFAEDGLEGVLKELPAVMDDLKRDIEEKLPQFIEVGNTLVSTLAEGISLMVPVLVPAAIEAINTLAEALIEPDTLKAILTAAGTVIITLVEGLIKNLPQILTTAWELIKELVKGVGQAVMSLLPNSAGSVISNFVKGVRDKFTSVFIVGAEIIGKVKEGLFSIIDKAKTWGSDMISNFCSGIRSMWDNVKKTAESIGGLIKKFLGFSVPEKGPLSDADTWGPDFMQLYADGISKNAWRVQNAVNGVASGMAMATPQINGMTAQQTRSTNDGLKIYLSTGQLVGGIAKNVNATLGYSYVQDVRGSLA